MPLTFNLRHLERKVLHLQGECPAGDFDLENVDEIVQITEPVRYDLWVEKLNKNILVRGSLSFRLNCECSRCLRPFKWPVELSDWSCDLALEGEERVPVENDSMDLTPILREDIFLAFPRHPLCKVECSGLPVASPKNQVASGTNAIGDVPSAWDQLNKLKL